MTTITIKVKGLDDIVRNFSNINVKQIFADAANRAVAEVKKWAMVEVPVDTSALQKSHIISPATMFTSHAEVYTEKEYAVPVHEGHRIVAWGHDTGRRQPPNPWMLRAAERSEGTINRIFEQAADEMAKQLTK